MGRGNNVGKYPGNMNFRRICWAYKAQYIKAYKEEKAHIAIKVLNEIAALHPPGRVLEPKEGCGYVLADPVRAIEKTCQLLREKKVKKPDGMESLPIAKMQVNKSLRRKKVKSINYSDDKNASASEEEDLRKTKRQLAAKAAKAVKKKATPPKRSKPQKTPIVVKSQGKRIIIKKANKTIGKTPRRSLRKVMTLSIKEDHISKIAAKKKEDAEKVRTDDTGSGSFPIVTRKAGKKSAPPSKETILPVSFMNFAPPRTPVMAFEPERCVFPEEPAEENPMDLLSPSELLRGLSTAFEPDAETVVPTADDDDDDNFEQALEGIAEPPPLTTLSSRGTSLCSIQLAFERVADTFGNRNLESPHGVADIPGPPMLISCNSLFMHEINAAESHGSIYPDVVFGDGDDGFSVKRKLW